MNLYGKIDVNWHVRKLLSQQKTDPHRTVFAEPLIAILHTAEHIGLDQAELLADIDLDIEILSLPHKICSVQQYFRLYQAAADEKGN